MSVSAKLFYSGVKIYTTVCYVFRAGLDEALSNLEGERCPCLNPLKPAAALRGPCIAEPQRGCPGGLWDGAPAAEQLYQSFVAVLKHRSRNECVCDELGWDCSGLSSCVLDELVTTQEG